jgi:hypothetical protein
MRNLIYLAFLTVVSSQTFSLIETTGLIEKSNRFNGGAAVGKKAYFAPHQERNVGVLDTSDNTFSTIEAVAVGTRIFFVPWNEKGIGVVDTEKDTFSMIEIKEVTATSAIFNGAAVVRSKIYFAPSNEARVGVLDTIDNTFTLLEADSMGRLRWAQRSILHLATRPMSVWSTQGVTNLV